MFIELIDALRCPNQHEESWLVLATSQMEARHVVHGTLGCPVCKAEYPIRKGVVDFRRNAPVGGPGHRSDSRADLAMRIAALLDLSDTSGFAVLTGYWGGHAEALTHIVEVPLILIDPPDGICGSAGISVVRTDGGSLPLAEGSARAIAIDDGSAERVASAVRVAKAKGRVLAPLSVTVKDGVKEIARDEAMWVGEREGGASPLVTLHVRRAE